MDIGKSLVRPIIERRRDFDIADEYYEGLQGERFLSRRFFQDFKDTYSNATTLNYMRPVVDNVTARLEISKVAGKSKKINEALEKIRANNNMEQLEKEAHRMAGSLGEAYIMVWINDNNEPVISLHDPRNTFLLYDPENPRKKLVGARIWFDAISGGHKMQVMYPDRIEKYSTPSEEVSAGSTWTLIDTVPNPFDEVPLFLFSPQGRSRYNVYADDSRTFKPYGRPEHYDGYGIQDDINKLTVTHMVTVDYQGAPQRWALAHPDSDGMDVDDFAEDETNREKTGLKNGPGELWYMKGIASVGQFDPAKPEVFLTPIDHRVRALASLTNTPIHYFKETGNVPSGNALRAAEAPMLKKVADRQVSYGTTWREIYTFAISIDMDKEAEILINWTSVESIDILEQWDVMAKKRNVGVPFRQVMHESGYDEASIEQMIKWKKEEQEQMASDYQRAANTNPEVRTNVNKDETKIGTGE